MASSVSRAKENRGSGAPTSPTSFLLTPTSMALAGASILVGSAVGTAVLHYKSSEKKLLEEGVPTTARRAAVPLATRALVSSAVGCVAIAGIAATAYAVLGGEYSGSTRVDWGHALQTARKGSEAIRIEVQKRLKGGDDHSD